MVYRYSFGCGLNKSSTVLHKVLMLHRMHERIPSLNYKTAVENGETMFIRSSLSCQTLVVTVSRTKINVKNYITDSIAKNSTLQISLISCDIFILELEYLF